MHLQSLDRTLGTFSPLSGNVYCIGRNYADHAKELNNPIPAEPVIFLKAPSALRALSDSGIAFAGESYHHEAEIVLLLGKSCAMGETPDLSLIIGIGLGLDLTRREVQNHLKKEGLPWAKAKSFKGSGILTPFKAFSSKLGPIDFSLAINGEIKQQGKSSDMLFDFDAILKHLLVYQDLEAGDIIFTGTPVGVGPIKQGDAVHLRSTALSIDESGTL